MVFVRFCCAVQINRLLRSALGRGRAAAGRVRSRSTGNRGALLCLLGVELLLEYLMAHTHLFENCIVSVEVKS